ncbi:MAG: hypothetical protein U1E39_09580 [Planctomycetota bacterium]
MRATLLSCLLLIGVVGRTVSAEPTRPPRPDPMALAPDGEWPMQDGCPARTRATPTRVPIGDLEVAWTFATDETICGDPCVVGERVYVATFGAEGPPNLIALRLSDGAVIAKASVPGRGPAIAAHRDMVVAVGGAQASVLRVSGDGSAPTVLTRFPARFSPVIVGGDLMTVGPAFVELRRMGAEEPHWLRRLDGRALGPPTIRDGTVYVVTTREVKGYEGTQSRIERFRLDGENLAPIVLGWDADGSQRFIASTVIAAPDELMLLHAPGFRLKDGAVGTGARIDLGVTSSVHFLDIEATPLVWGGSSIVRYRPLDGKQVLLRSDPREHPDERKTGGWRWFPLATEARHAELLTGELPGIVAGGVVMLPGGSFEVASRRLVESWRTPRYTRRLPVREAVLEIAGREVRALRRSKASRAEDVGPRLPRDADAKAVAIPGGAVVLVDGSARAGDLTYSPAEGLLAGVGKEKLRHDDLGLVLDREGRVVHGPDPRFIARRVRTAAAARAKGEWVALAKKAVATRSAPVLAAAIDEAVARGARPDEVASLRKEVAKLEKPQGAPPKVDPAKVADIERATAALEAKERAALRTALFALPADTPVPYRAPLLRAVLADTPDDPEVAAWLRARLPAGFDPGAEVAPSAWLDLIEATVQAPVTILASKPEGGTLTMDERTFGALRAAWRPDLVALRSERLLLVTPVARPSRIARCLSLGELVCSTLDGLFQVTGEQTRLIDPLVVQLFETKEEYVARSPADADGSESGRAWLTWTLGHYDGGEGISRLYVPPGDDPFDGVMETLAHELTHHWLDQRMPRPRECRGKRGKSTSPCYFLEEGFATMVEEFVYDVAARTFDTKNPRADSLDTVAQSSQLLDWTRVVEMTPAEFRRLGHAFEHEVPSRWTLDSGRRLSETNLFYAQGAAICHYLWNAEGGKHRELLRAWVRDLHCDRVAPGETQRRLNLTPAQLGRTVVAWAKQVTSPGD